MSQQAAQAKPGIGIKEFYTGKTIFLTGTTGFVGKVVLEKIIRTLHTFKKLFIMVRGKKNKTVRERFEKEILSAEIFTPLFAKDPNLLETLRRKVVPVAGDLVIDKLGLSQADRAMVTAETDVVINCAASVNFDDPLLDALEINYFGCLRMLELAKECVNILTFTHVSTAYVNSYQPNNSRVEEKVYDLPNGEDPEEAIARIMKLGPQKVQEQEAAILGSYPNTYTFTKAYAERALKKRRGDLPVTILRPSIITSCYDDPFEGWIDSPAASGGVIIGISSGILHIVYSNGSSIMDLVPCDFVTNNILVQTAVQGLHPNPEINVVHAATTTKNPISSARVRDIVVNYCRFNPWYQQVAQPWAEPIASTSLFTLGIALTERLPLRMMQMYASATGDKKMRKQATFMQGLSDKMFSMQSIFHHFLYNMWRYQLGNTDRTWSLMSEQERQEFKIDVSLFNWEKAFIHNIYGLRRFYFKEDVLPPTAGFMQLLQKGRPDLFHDIRLSAEAMHIVQAMSNEVYFKDILMESNFLAYVSFMMQTQQQTRPIQKDPQLQARKVKSHNRFLFPESPTIPFDVAAARIQLAEMKTSMTPTYMRLFYWYFNKNFRRNIQGLMVDTESVKMVKDLIAKNNKVVFLPLYKSYLDFFVQMYVMATQKIKLGYTFGNYEDTPRITVIDKWLKSCGYIFSRRKPGQSLQSNYINSEMLKEVITNNQVTTVYQNYERFRAGKLHRKQQADMSIRWLLEAFANLQQQGSNLILVPVMVSYDRIYEGLNIATEMISGEKRDYTFLSGLKKIHSTGTDALGHIYLRYLEPINMEQYVSRRKKGMLCPANLEESALKLTADLMERQQRATPITLNSLLSAILLQEKKPSMQLSQLLSKSGMIYEYLKQKHYLLTYMTVKPMQKLSEKHVRGLGFKMNQVTKKDAQILLNTKDDDLRVKLILAHYSMQLMPAFMIEGCLAIFLKNAVFTNDSYQDGTPVAMRPLYDILTLYADLFKNESFLNSDLSKTRVMQSVDFFVQKGYLRVEGDSVTLINRDQCAVFLDFFGNLIHPMIDTYLITLTVLTEMCGKNYVVKFKKLTKEIHLCIKRLYQLQVITHLHSCLIETIQTALTRFEQMGFIEMRAYATKAGTSARFLTCPAESKPRIETLWQQMRQHRRITKEQEDTSFAEIEETIRLMQGPIQFARL